MADQSYVPASCGDRLELRSRLTSSHFPFPIVHLVFHIRFGRRHPAFTLPLSKTGNANRIVTVWSMRWDEEWHQVMSLWEKRQASDSHRGGGYTEEDIPG